jgi:hypothetical protein
MLKDVVSGLLNEKYNPASFTPAMRTFLTTATGKAFWKWFAEHGSVGAFIFSDREERKSVRWCVTRQAWEKIRTGCLSK